MLHLYSGFKRMGGMEKKSILIVDDEQVILDVTADALGRSSFNFLFAKSGEEGLTMLQKHDVHLVISDQKMVGMTGVEFLKKAKQMDKDIVTIMLTGYADIETAVKAINDAGVYRFIIKPWNVFDLRATVWKAIESRDLILEKEVLLKKIKEYEDVLMRIKQNHPRLIDQEGSHDQNIDSAII